MSGTMFKLTPWVFVSIVSACLLASTTNPYCPWGTGVDSVHVKERSWTLSFYPALWTDASFWNPPGLLPSLQRRGLSVGFLKNFFLRAKQGDTHTHTHTHTHTFKEKRSLVLSSASPGRQWCHCLGECWNLSAPFPPLQPLMQWSWNKVPSCL